MVMNRKAGGGRPPKFDEPSRPVTVTLPESTLNALELVNQDRAKAIVTLAKTIPNHGNGAPPSVEIIHVASQIGLLIVGYSQALRKIPFLHLVEVAPGRFLLALDSGNDFHTLEIAIQDILEELTADQEYERTLISTLLEKVKSLRKSERVSMAEILLVKLD
jgi:hypothetical protein